MKTGGRYDAIGCASPFAERDRLAAAAAAARKAHFVTGLFTE
jgi:hypothetical protein